MEKKDTIFIIKIIKKKILSFITWDEGVREIRITRLKKLRKKNKGLVIGTQIVAIWYLLILTASYLTSHTGAYFNDVEVIKNSIHAGIWEKGPEEPEKPDVDKWDKSSLDFDGSKVRVEGCNVYSTIYNAGDKANSSSTWRYYLYKVENRKTVGEPVSTGVVPTIQRNGQGEISAKVTENGDYLFKVRRPLGHPGNNNPDEDGYTYIQSDNIITVTKCNNSQVPEQTTPDSPDKAEKPSEEQPSEEQPKETEPAEQPENEKEDETEIQPVEKEDQTPPPTQEPEEDLPPGEVTELSWESSDKGNSGKAVIRWINPADSDFDHVNVYVEGQDKPQHGKLKSQEVEVKIQGDSVKYRVMAVDKAGNESAGIVITVTPEKPAKN